MIIRHLFNVSRSQNVSLVSRRLYAQVPTYVRFAQQGGQYARSRGIPPLYLVGGGGALLGGYVLLNLERVEQTGRWRFIAVSEATERRMGDEAAKEIMSKYGRQILPDQHPLASHVRQVAFRVLDASGLRRPRTSPTAPNAQGRKADVNWRVIVIRSPEHNAMVLPNGLICVFSGILDVCQNDDALAAVLGHEIAHQVARHSAEKMSGAGILSVAGLLLDLVGLDPSISRIGMHYLLSLPNSRSAEREADHIGLLLMSKACYDPRATPSFWQRMSQGDQGGGRPPAFLSTHPAHADRVKKIESWLPEALDARPESCSSLSAHLPAFRRTFSSA